MATSTQLSPAIWHSGYFFLGHFDFSYTLDQGTVMIQMPTSFALHFPMCHQSLDVLLDPQGTGVKQDQWA